MLKAKLTSRRGETLAEILVTILIIAMSSAIMVVTLTTAVRINTTADEATRTLYQELSYAEGTPGAAGGTSESTGRVTVSVDGGAGKSVDVTVRGGSDALRSYGREVGG